MPLRETRHISLLKSDQASSDDGTPVPVVHAPPPDIGRVDQEKQLIVLIYQIRGLVIVIHVPIRTSAAASFSSVDWRIFFSRRERRHGAFQVLGDHLDRHRADALRPCQLESGEDFPGELAGGNYFFAGPSESFDGFTWYKLYQQQSLYREEPERIRHMQSRNLQCRQEAQLFVLILEHCIRPLTSCFPRTKPPCASSIR
jgi:hypothetical protein